MNAQLLKVAPVVVACLISMPAQAVSVELITNGGFETGTLAGWTVDDLAGGSGSFFIESASTTPLSGNFTAGPSSGVFYAVSDQSGPGTHALTQTFLVPGGATSVVLSFAMFVNDSDSGPIVDPIGLDHTGAANQHARVDLLLPGAPAFDTGAFVLANLYTGVDGPPVTPYSPYVFDITPYVGGGGVFALRFAEVDNQLFLNQGVDDVSVIAEVVPVPAALWLFGSALGLLGVTRRRTA